MTNPEPRTAVIGAMPEETATLDALLEHRTVTTVGPYELLDGTLDGHPVTLAVCGVGKVNAAALTQTLLEHGATRVLFTGVAGAVDPDLAVGDVVVSRDAVQHDVDVTPLGYDRGMVPGEPLTWQADPTLVEIAVKAAREAVPEARIVTGRIASGDQFIADPQYVAQLRSDFAATCTEMEGAAVAHVCARWDIPWVVIRSISDTADHDASVDFRAFTEIAAQRAGAVVRGMLQQL